MAVSRSIKLFFLILCVSVSNTGRTVAAGDPPLRLTLKEAIRMAVEKNLEVRAELYNAAIGEADIRKNLGIYDPLLSLYANYQEATTLPVSTFLSGTSLSRQKNLYANAGISQRFPIGGQVGLYFNNTWNRNNSDSSAGFLNDYWQSQLTVSYSQPILKNFGREATELGILVAVNNKNVSIEQFRTKLLDVVSRVRTAYFTLQGLKENLEAKKSALNLALKILEDTKGRVKAGVLPAMEILNAQYGVVSREKERIDAEKDYRDQMDVVRRLLKAEENLELDPVDLPIRDEYAVDEFQAIKRALQDRPEVKAQKIALQTADLQTRVAYNRVMPDLTFNASAALTGLGQDYPRNLDRLGTGKYPIWGVGLQLTYPLGNRDAENDFIKSRLKGEQARLQLANLEDAIKDEVKRAIRGIRARFLQLDVADRRLAYAEERMRAYVKKNEVGLATTKEVVDVENDLVAAKTNQIRARADYAIAIGDFWKATGELLEREGVALTVRDADTLYDVNSR